MNTFSLHGYRSLNDGLMELYATHDLVELAHISIRMIRQFVPSDLTSRFCAAIVAAACGEFELQLTLELAASGGAKR